MSFRWITAEDFAPFGAMRMDFPAVPDRTPGLGEVHLLVGGNGSGKTRLLSVLTALLGNPDPLTLRLEGTKEPLEFKGALLPTELLESSNPEAAFVTGDITASENRLHRMNLPQPFQRIPAVAYAPAPYLENAKVDPAADYRQPARAVQLEFHRPPQHSAAVVNGIYDLMMQEALTRMGTGSSGPSAAGVVERIHTALSEVAGQAVTFSASAIPQRKLEVVFGQRRPVSFTLLPDGLRTLIGWMADVALQLVLSPEQPDTPPLEKHCIVIIDEPEMHLHPAWQRQVLPVLQRLLPNAQIIAATHSPWLVCSVNEGWLHRLKIGAAGKVEVMPPQELTAGDSVLDVLEDVMEVPQWYDPESERMLDELKAWMERLPGLSGGEEHLAVPAALALAEQVARRGEALAQIVAPDLLDLQERAGEQAAK